MTQAQNFPKLSPKLPNHKLNGWIFLDKPSGITSNQALSQIKRTLNIKPARRGKGTKIGFAGTLDPLATGLLPIAIGEATKVLPYVVEDFKTYEFTVRWGQGTDTDDAEGDIVAESPVIPTPEQILEILPLFTGTIKQTPPQFAAVKINGQRAYDLARQGQDVKIKERDVVIHKITLLSHTDNFAVFEVDCGKGTYVRALARDIGKKLNTFGHITQLRRTRIGDITNAQMISLDHVSAAQILPVETVITDIPVLPINTTPYITALKNGQKIMALLPVDQQEHNKLFRVMHQGNLLALGQWQQGYFVPNRVFNL